MCMGAILWAGLDRVVFGASIEQAALFDCPVVRRK
jgi:tRNA(Arg) A34 adenosine deaminase TadA